MSRLFDQHTVFIVAERCGAEPCRAVLFVYMALFAKRLERLINFSVFVQGRFRIPYVKRHAEIFQVGAKFIKLVL